MRHDRFEAKGIKAMAWEGNKQQRIGKSDWLKRFSIMVSACQSWALSSKFAINLFQKQNFNFE